MREYIESNWNMYKREMLVCEYNTKKGIKPLVAASVNSDSLSLLFVWITVSKKCGLYQNACAKDVYLMGFISPLHLNRLQIDAISLRIVSLHSHTLSL